MGADWRQQEELEEQEYILAFGTFEQDFEKYVTTQEEENDTDRPSNPVVPSPETPF